jgi:hypothetical protein
LRTTAGVLQRGKPASGSSFISSRNELEQLKQRASWLGEHMTVLRINGKAQAPGLARIETMTKTSPDLGNEINGLSLRYLC